MSVTLETTVSYPLERGVLDLPRTTITALYKGCCMVAMQVLSEKGLSDGEILSIMQERMAKSLAYAYEVGIREGIALANAKRKETPKALNDVLDIINANLPQVQRHLMNLEVDLKYCIQRGASE